MYAGRAPAGPEVDQHHPAAVVGKTMAAALEIGQVQGGWIRIAGIGTQAAFLLALGQRRRFGIEWQDLAWSGRQACQQVRGAGDPQGQAFGGLLFGRGRVGAEVKAIPQAGEDLHVHFAAGGLEHGQDAGQFPVPGRVLRLQDEQRQVGAPHHRQDLGHLARIGRGHEELGAEQNRAGEHGAVGMAKLMGMGATQQGQDAAAGAEQDQPAPVTGGRVEQRCHVLPGNARQAAGHAGQEVAGEYVHQPHFDAPLRKRPGDAPLGFAEAGLRREPQHARPAAGRKDFGLESRVAGLDCPALAGPDQCRQQQPHQAQQSFH